MPNVTSLFTYCSVVFTGRGWVLMTFAFFGNALDANDQPTPALQYVYVGDGVVRGYND